MQIFKHKGFQLLASFMLGLIFGVWQYIPGSESEIVNKSLSAKTLISKIPSAKLNKSALKDTAAIEPLLALKAPDKDASVQDWYNFALRFDDLDLGKRYRNYGQTTPMLSWYAYIAKYKPQAIYKLYNQGKLKNPKFKHLLQTGYLSYWEEYIQDVDKVLLSLDQAVLSMAYEKGAELTRKRVAKAFFKVSDEDLSSRHPKLNIENLLFAMKSMNMDEKIRVKHILEKGLFNIDPRSLYRLKHTEIYRQDSENKALLALMEMYAGRGSYYKRMMSSYMTDGALLGNKDYLTAMIKDIETNANQPTNFYCAACGIALSSDGLMAYSLINTSKKNKVEINKNENNQFIITRKN